MAADLSGFKTYAEWQAANRAAGGPGHSAEVAAQFAQRNNPVPTAPVTPSGGPGGGNQAIDVNSFRTSTAPGPVNLGNVSAAQAGIQAWGAEIGEQNRQTANMTPEQRARWAQEHINSFDAQSRNPMDPQQAFNQWLAWDDKYDASCPPNRPYRGRTGTCEEGPDNCPEGTTLHGSKCISNEQANQLFGGGYGGQPQGGQQGQSAGGPAAPGLDPNDPNSALQDALVALYQERGGMFGGSDAGEALKGGGIWWGSQGAPLPMAPATQAQAATQSIAQNQAQAPQPAPQPQANTSTISQPNTGENMLQKSLSSTLQAMPAPTRQVDPLVDQLRQTNKWWAGDRNSPLEA